MDEFKPEDDFRPDTSDRRPTRSRRSTSVPRFTLSRQHLMIGTGMLVLILLIIGVGSALKAPTGNQVTQQGKTRDINLSDSSSLASPTSELLNSTTETHGNGSVAQSQQRQVQQQPQNISAPPISATPTEAQSVQRGGAQQSLDLPGGNLADALSSQQGPVDTLALGIRNAASMLPTAPATLMNGSAAKETARSVNNNRVAPVQPEQPRKAPVKPVVNRVGNAVPPKQPSVATTIYIPPAVTKKLAVSGNTGSMKSVPSHHYMLQLSSASRADTLNAFAKQQSLQGYTVYETKRDGKPWYVLVTGNYASSADAKRAIATLPTEIQAKQPWVRPVHQIQQELKK